ncbi:hypothetical protein HPB51_015416 [Rhipicephalus microplus]|uniref:CCHC-type domain-containing protein n=1 Tax=Rhipicephalus microplus TaxID=6941 RepID=A0A9J6DV48_RHIMP|nr:hypothetical protein HPB51_015416 [Rhipicephalus microplus]
MRRNNLIIKGIPENGQEGYAESEAIVKDFCSTHLKLNVGDIERAHRIGQRRPGFHRPIIIKFLNFKTKTEVLRNAPKLKNLDFPKVWIEEDFSPKVQLARRKLREYARSNREGTEPFSIRYNSLHLKGSIYRYDPVKDNIVVNLSVDYKDQVMSLVYTLSQEGKPVPAETAVDAMSVVNETDMSRLLGYPVVVKAEPYLKPAQEESVSRLASIVAGVLASIFVLVLLFLVLYCKCCRPKVHRSPYSDSGSVRSYGRANRRKMFEESAGKFGSLGEKTYKDVFTSPIHVPSAPPVEADMAVKAQESQRILREQGLRTRPGSAGASGGQHQAGALSLIMMKPSEVNHIDSPGKPCSDEDLKEAQKELDNMKKKSGTSLTAPLRKQPLKRFMADLTLVVVAGRAPICLRCRGTGHISGDCRAPRCAVCRRFGHGESGGARTYASVADFVGSEELSEHHMNEAEVEELIGASGQTNTQLNVPYTARLASAGSTANKDKGPAKEVQSTRSAQNITALAAEGGRLENMDTSNTCLQKDQGRGARQEGKCNASPGGNAGYGK